MSLTGLTLVDGSARVDLDPQRRVPILDVAALERLERCLDAARQAGVSTLILRGGTAGTFAAGADLAELARLRPLEAWEFSRRGQALLDRVARLPAVTIAAIGGRCVGGALDLVMACDLRLADPSAIFAHPGPRLGFITGYGGTGRLPDLAGPASRGILLGLRELDAEAARRAGLVSDLVAPGGLDDACAAIARRLAEVPATDLRLVKEALGRLPGAARPAALERSLSRAALMMRDTREDR